MFVLISFLGYVIVEIMHLLLYALHPSDVEMSNCVFVYTTHVSHLLSMILPLRNSFKAKWILLNIVLV